MLSMTLSNIWFQRTAMPEMPLLIKFFHGSFPGSVRWNIGQRVYELRYRSCNYRFLGIHLLWILWYSDSILFICCVKLPLWALVIYKIHKISNRQHKTSNTDVKWPISILEIVVFVLVVILSGYGSFFLNFCDMANNFPLWLIMFFNLESIFPLNNKIRIQLYKIIQ